MHVPTTKRFPPADLLAEQQLLAALIGDTQLLNSIDGLRAWHFIARAHAELFETITAGQIPDQAACLTALGITLPRLIDALAEADPAPMLAERILDAWLRRHLVFVGQKITAEAFQNNFLTGPEIIALARQWLARLERWMRQDAARPR